MEPAATTIWTTHPTPKLRRPKKPSSIRQRRHAPSPNSKPKRCALACRTVPCFFYTLIKDSRRVNRESRRLRSPPYAVVRCTPTTSPAFSLTPTKTCSTATVAVAAVT